MHVISVIRRIIVNFCPPPSFDLFQFEFSHKNIVSLSVFCVMYTILYLNLKHILSFVMWIDRLITCSKKSLPQLCVYFWLRCAFSCCIQHGSLSL